MALGVRGLRNTDFVWFRHARVTALHRPGPTGPGIAEGREFRLPALSFRPPLPLTRFSSGSPHCSQIPKRVAYIIL
jgi:hypothetical protein